MPRYDKKLEASRSDFYNDILSTRDVDCALATGEILDIINDLKIDTRGKIYFWLFRVGISRSGTFVNLRSLFEISLRSPESLNVICCSKSRSSQRLSSLEHHAYLDTDDLPRVQIIEILIFNKAHSTLQRSLRSSNWIKRHLSDDFKHAKNLGRTFT